MSNETKITGASAPVPVTAFRYDGVIFKLENLPFCLMVHVLFKRDIRAARDFLHTYGANPKGKTDDEQRKSLTDFWHEQLGVVGPGTMDARAALQSSGTLLDWITTFQNKVWPLIKSNHLPKKLLPPPVIISPLLPITEPVLADGV